MRSIALLLLLLVGILTRAEVLVQDLTTNTFLVDGNGWQNFTDYPVTFDHRVVKIGDVFDITVGGTMDKDSLARRKFQFTLGGQVLAETGDMFDVIGAQQGMRYVFRFTIECTDATVDTVSYRCIDGGLQYGDIFNQVSKVFILNPVSMTVGMNDGYFMMQVNMDVTPDNAITITNDRFIVVAVANTRFNTGVTNMAFTSPQCTAATPTVGVVLSKIGNVATLHVPATTCQSNSIVLTTDPIVLTSNTAIPMIYRPSAILKDGVIYSNAGVELTGGIVGVSTAGIITISFSATLALNAAFGTSSAFSISWIVV